MSLRHTDGGLLAGSGLGCQSMSSAGGTSCVSRALSVALTPLIKGTPGKVTFINSF